MNGRGGSWVPAGVLAGMLGVALGVVSAAGAQAPELEVKARIEPAGPYLVGDPIRFVWEVTHEPKVQLDSDLVAPLGAALAGAGFEGRGAQATVTTTGAADTAAAPRVEQAPAAAVEGRQRVVLSAPVTTFTTGVHRVAAVSLSYKNAAGARQSASTPEMVVPVQSVMVGAKAEPKGVKPPRPYPWAVSLPAWAWALILATAGGLGWLLLRRRAPKVVAAPPLVPPDVEALRKIDALVAEDLPKSGLVKEFCDRISDIARSYLGRRFGLASMGDTSDELLEELKTGKQLAEEERERLRAFLEECDLAKFAKHTPEPAQLNGLVEATRTLVARTRPVEVAEEGPK